MLLLSAMVVAVRLMGAEPVAVIGPITEICPVVTSVLAVRLPPVLKVPSVISPVATRMAVPVTLAGPVCVIVPVEFTDRLLVLREGRARSPVMMLRLSSVVVEPIEPLKLTAPAPALIER